MNYGEAAAAFAQDRPHLEARGIYLGHGVQAYIPIGAKQNYMIAMDAQPQLSTAPSSGIPWQLTNMIDPEIVNILFAPNNATKILSETRKGDWLMDTTMFPVVEHSGEVSSYGDYSNNGSAGANTNFPMRQNYLYQTVEQYGERELERAGLAKINWVSEIDASAMAVLAKFQNLSYFFGIQGLQNYGLVNDPNLSAALTPSTKAYGNNRWITNGFITATANEIYNDIVALFSQIVSQTMGLVDKQTPMVLAMSPGSDVALTATNSFNVNVSDLLKKNFPNIRIETAVQYGALDATNPQGIAAGNMVQLIVPTIEAQQTGYCSFSEKARSHPIIKMMSAFMKKVTSGTWGAIIKMPIGLAQMVGV